MSLEQYYGEATVNLRFSSSVLELTVINVGIVDDTLAKQ
jgi:hypothetical protein